MDILLPVLYVLAALVHIVSILHEWHGIRFVSKICLMPILMLFHVFASGGFSFAFVLALAFSWCGDILTWQPLAGSSANVIICNSLYHKELHPNPFHLPVKSRKAGLYAGILGFLSAHVLYVLAFIDLIPEINSMTFVFSFLPVLSIECFFMAKLHIPGRYKFFMMIYGIAIGLLAVFSAQVFVWHKNLAGILLVIGSVSFFVSDAVLAYFNTAKPMTKKPLAAVMSGYIIAQACISAGYANI